MSTPIIWRSGATQHSVSRLHRWSFWLALLACNAALGAGPASAPAAGASDVRATAPAAPAASAPPVSVTTVPARLRDLPVLLEATGTVTPTAIVDVRAQMTSVVTQSHIREGQFVKAGDPLFTLDARAEEANVARLRAQLAKDEVALVDARRQLARSRELLAQNFISQGAVDASQTLVETQLAVIEADKAAIEAARVTLSYARISAPSAGRIGTINLFPGSAVQANQTTLVTVTQLDPIDVAFSVPQRHLADVLAALKTGMAPVELTLPEAGGRRKGRLQFVDSSVDAASGTVKVKARFANKDNKLWPGAFAKASLTVRTLEGVTVVPTTTIVQTTRGSIVYAVVEGKAVIRPVQIVQAEGDDTAVTGVRPGEKIVLDGRQNLRPGSHVIERPREGGGKGSGSNRGGKGGGGDGPRGEKGEKGDGGGDKAGKGEKGEKGDRAGKGDKAGKGAKDERPADGEKPEKARKAAKEST
jgi:RND family efflux transporter MFP subunit